MSEATYQIAFWFAVFGSAVLCGAYGADHEWSWLRTMLLAFTGLAVLILLRGAILT